MSKYSRYNKNHVDFTGFVEFCKANNIKSQIKFLALGSSRPDNIPSTPHKKYKAEWKGWAHISGNEFWGKRNFVSFEKFVDFCQRHNVKTINKFRYIIRPVDIPSNPQKVYKNKWKGWAYITKSRGKHRWISFKEARAYMHTQNLVSRTHVSRGWLQWQKLGNRPHNIPSNPYTVYRKEWTNWYDFLGTNRLNYPKSKFYAIASQIRLKKDWTKKGMAKYGIEKPGSIPLSIRNAYPDNWEGIKSFLGTKPVKYEVFIDFLIQNDINNSSELKLYPNKPKGIISRAYYYKKWPGWAKFRKGILEKI